MRRKGVAGTVQPDVLFADHQDSTSASVGNVVKPSGVFLHNFGVHGTFPFLACYVFWLPWRGMLAAAPDARTTRHAADTARVAHAA